MLVVGLTGGIASGKSTVSSLLSSHHIPIIDADHLARVVVAPGTRGYRAIVAHFGQDVVIQTPNGPTLDRAKLGSVVFNDEKERRVLNGIVHPAVRKEMVRELLKNWLRGEKVVVVDVPLLVETELWRWCGWVVVVYVNEACQLSRLLARPQLNPSDPPLTATAARSRISAQLPLVSKLPYADTVIDNSGSPADLEVQVEALIRRWRSSTKGWGFIEWICPPVGLWVGFFTLVWRNLKAARRRARRGDKGQERRRGRGENGKFRKDENIELKVM